MGEQSLNVNQRVAVEMSEILSELLLTQTLKRFAAYFDLESGASRSVYSTPEAIAKAVNYQPRQKSKSKPKIKIKAASRCFETTGKNYESINEHYEF